jgi:hypothetical protein
MQARHQEQSGQVMVLVAVALLALIGSAALILLAGSVEWQKNQLQELADSTAMNSALTIGIGCDAAKAPLVIKAADDFLATRRTKLGPYGVAAGTCATPYKGTDFFAGGLSATYNYPYRARQQQVEVILTLTLPISFGGELGTTNTTVIRRAVAQALPGSVPAVSATSLTCGGGQVNVAGNVVAQNTITIAGSCALYAHTRFDAASGTYSSLGNIRVYADGQSWVGGGGACSAGLNSGSSNAICADGSEVSGHVNPACGTTGTSQLLSAGGAATNPNPCAAGVAPQPVFPRGTGLPPDPNADAAAIGTLTGNGGAPCAAGTAYPPIKVGVTTVATGLAAAPVKDASGFYHFKPSCYGYLDPSSLTGGGGGGITLLHAGPQAGPSTKDVIPALGANSTAGTLLVATIRSDTSAADKPFTAPAGWVSAIPGGVDLDGTAHVEIWYYPNNPGGIPNADFGVSPASVNAVAQMSEWSGVAIASPLDQTGVASVNSSQSSATVSTSGPTIAANELVITDIGTSSAQNPESYTPQAGWTGLINDTNDEFSSQYRPNLPAGVASETVTGSQPTTWAMMIAAFKPAGGGGGGGSGAVLDPGFYYFNGSGFAGGGGICLNGGTLLARDVTLEFVNQAGFSSGTCAAGGGAACAGSCQFGSTPCSISICPPNALADPLAPLGGNTWFAAPCSQLPPAPGTQDTSCSGSWCPAGDRACQNLLIYTPAASTGQIALSGSAVRAWLLGSIYWAGTCTYAINGTSVIDGSLACGTLTISAGAGAGIGVGSDYGIGVATVEAILIE